MTSLAYIFYSPDYRAKRGGSRSAGFCGIPAVAGNRGRDGGKKGLPPGEGFWGEQGAELTKEEVSLGDCLCHEIPGETGKGTKKGTVESKGTVCSCKTET